MDDWDISIHAAYAGGLAVRVEELRQHFPEALVSCDVDDNYPGPDLICWNAHPEQIWVWIFESNDAEGIQRAEERLNQVLAAPYDLTTIVDKPVVAGPNGIFEQDCVTASSYFDVDGRIEVRSGPGDGIQLYRAFSIDGEDDIMQRVAINLTLGAARKADRDSRQALGFQGDDRPSVERPNPPADNSEGRP